MLSTGTTLADVVFLVDVDNTLLDNDRFIADLGNRLEERFGAEQRARYFEGLARLREHAGFVDYLGALQVFRDGLDDAPALLEMGEFILEYPFADRLYPDALSAVAHLESMGRSVVLSDGDVVLQPRKVHRAGIWDAVGGRVMVCVHKERVMDHVLRRHPASHYVMIDDKRDLLAAMKRVLGAKLTTIFVRQGQYAAGTQAGDDPIPPDRVIEKIGDLLTFKLSELEVSA